MTWLNRGFKVRHKIFKEKEMKAEAIRALELFKEQHLAKAVNEQADMVSESSEQPKENQMEQRKIDIESLRYPPREVAPTEPTKQKGVNFNYPDHIAPLKQRIMSALNNGARSVESVARYCKEEEKLINLQLNRWVSRGMIGKHIVPSSGNVKYYPYEIAKEMGILTEPKPINYWTKERKAKQEAKKRSSSSAPTHQPQPVQIKPQTTQESQYIAFLEKRITEWQTEARKMANQISELEAQVIKAKAEPRNVTGEVAEVMQEVMELRSTVAYLESKLFGRK